MYDKINRAMLNNILNQSNIKDCSQIVEVLSSIIESKHTT